MVTLRRIANSLIRGSLAFLDDAPPEAMERAYRVLRWVAARVGATLPETIDHRLLRSGIGTVARAIADTPYGLPLQFDCPLLVTIAVSDYCPFACANCYSNSGRSGPDTRATEQDAASFAKLAVSETPFILITGGEPLVSHTTRPGVARLLEAGKAVYISTNTSVESYLDLATQHRLLIFIMPIWGARVQHDALRGPGSFERVTRNLQWLNGVGRKGWLLVVLTSNDLSVFEEVIELARTHTISVVRITRKVSVGRENGPGADVTAPFLRAVQAAAARLRRFVPNVLIDLPETRAGRRWTFVARALGIPHNPSCAAGSWMMHVDAGGDAYPCYTFEGGTTARVAPMPSVAEQWRLVRDRRAALDDSDICIGEAVRHREAAAAPRLPLRLVGPEVADLTRRPA